MSRIYDALQRADVERKTAQGTDAIRFTEPSAGPGADALPSIKAEVNTENITLHSWKPSTAFLPTLGDRGESIEQFRGLRSKLYQFRDQSKLKTILISSGVPAEGKTFVAANLAISLARNKNNRVLLIDGDLRSPSLHGILGAPGIPGLAEYLTGAAEPCDIMQRSQDPSFIDEGQTRSISNLTFIPAGAGGDNSSELVANHRIEELIAILTPHFDWILIDSPPVLAVADAVDMAHAADAVLLVARGATTPYDVAQRAQAAFSNSRILGFVLNAVKDAPPNSSYSYYYGKQEASSGLPGRKDMGRQG
jgi:capsular exopolysaccharide synthesis family protein